MSGKKYLTDLQEAFVQAVLRGEKQRHAFREAYPSSRKWKDSVVDSKASNMLANPPVRARYEELRDRLVKESDDEAIASAKEVLQFLTSVKRASMKDFVRFGTKKTPLVADGQPVMVDGQPLMSGSSYVEVLDSDTVDGTLIAEVIQSQGGVKLRLLDKMKAAELLGKHHGLFEEKVEVKHTYVLQLPDGMTDA